MSYEDRLHRLFARAEQGMPPGPAVSWEATIAKARRDRLVHMAVVATAITLVVGGGVWSAVALLGERNPRPVLPINTPTDATPSPEATESPDRVEAACPAAGLPATPAQEPGLDPDAAATREDIVAAAVDCDYERLASIIESGGRREFSWSFGHAPDPEAFIRSLERSEGETLDRLVDILDLPYCEQRFEEDGVPQVFYRWPSADCEGATDEDWDALRGIYGDEDIAGWRELGSYLGYRVGIDGDGAWRFFVAGD